MPIYAHCFNCDLDFELTRVRVGEVRKLEIVGSHPEKCPRCGADARMMEGTYSTTPQRTRVISAPEWSRDLVERMQAQFREIDRIAHSRKYTDEEAKSRVEALLSEIEPENPTVVAEYRKRADPSDRTTWSRSAKALLTVFTIMETVNGVGDFVTRVQGAWEFFSARAGSSGVVEIHNPLPDDGWGLPEEDA